MHTHECNWIEWRSSVTYSNVFVITNKNKHNNTWESLAEIPISSACYRKLFLIKKEKKIHLFGCLR